MPRLNDVELGRAIDSVSLPLEHTAYNMVTDECRRARASETRLIEALKIALSHVVSGRRLDTTWEDIARAALKGAE